MINNKKFYKYIKIQVQYRTVLMHNILLVQLHV